MTRSASTNPNVALLSTIRMWLTMAPDSIITTETLVSTGHMPLPDARPMISAAFSVASESERKALLRQIEEALGMPPTASTNG